MYGKLGAFNNLATHVPLEIRLPWAPLVDQPRAVQHLDVLPTIVDALGWEPRTLWGTSLLKARDPDRVFLTTNDWGASLRTPMHKYTYVRTKWVDRGPVWRPLHKATAHHNEVVLADSDCSFPKSVLEMPRMHDLLFKALGEWSAPIRL